MVRIAVYASPLRSIRNPTGVGQHIAHMVDELATQDNVATSLLATRNDYQQVRPYLSEQLARLPVHYLPEAERLLRIALLSTNWFSVDRWCGDAEWVYSPKEQPVATTRARLAVTVHDLLPLEPALPGWPRRFRLSSWVRWRLMMRRVVQRADLIATVSDFTRQRLIELVGLPDSRHVVVVGNGVSPCYFEPCQPKDRETLERFDLLSGSYFLSIGSLTFRKGGDVLLSLAEKLRRERHDVKLVVTGRRHDTKLRQRYEALEHEKPDSVIKLVGYVSDEEQAVLLRHSLGLLFPTRYEGFGIPVLEAMAAGTPVICSRAAAVPEIAGESALFVGSERVEAWYDHLRALVAGTHDHTSLIESGRCRAKAFTWQRCAQRLIQGMATV